MKKLTDLEFTILCVNKELEIVDAPVRYDDVKQNKVPDWFDQYSFKTEEQYKEWEQFFYDHFYDWQPKHISKRLMKCEFENFALNYGLTNDF